MSWFTRLFARQKSIPEDPRRVMQYLPVSQLPAGIHLTMQTAFEISAVWACIEAITKAIASSPWKVWTKNVSGDREYLPDDPTAYVLNVRPSPDVTSIAFREAMMFATLSWGNGYAEIIKDGAGRVSALEVLMPDRVQPRRLSREEGYALVYDYYNPTGETITLPASSIFHVHGPGISGLMGDNMVSRASKAMALSAAMERYASTYFGNNAKPGGVIEYPKVLNDVAYKQMKSSWEDMHKGPDKAHKIAILENGATFKQYDTNAEESQLMHARQYQLEEICRFYSVPPHKIQHLLRSTFNNIEHLSIEWVRDGLTPWALRLEQEANHKLFSSRGAFRATKIDLAWLSHGDAKSRADYYKVMREMGVYTVNEIREKEGDNSIGPDGDVRMVPLNMQTLRQLELAEETAELTLEQQTSQPDDGGTNEADGASSEDGANQSGDSAAGDDQGSIDPENLLRDALVALFASVFDRYDKRVKNREADLAKNASAPTDALNAERTRLRPWIMAECKHAIALAEKLEAHDIRLSISVAASAVDMGEPPEKAALRLVDTICDRKAA